MSVLRTNWFTPGCFVKRLSLMAGISEVYSLLDQGLLSFMSLAVTLLTGRFCEKEELGLYALGLSIVIFFSEFQTALIATPYLIKRPNLEGEELQEYTGSVLTSQIAFVTTVILLLSVVSGFVFFKGSNEGVRQIFLVLTLTIAPILIRDFFRSLCYASSKPASVLRLDLLVSLTQLAGLTLLALNSALSARRAFVVIGAACGLASLIWLTANRKMFSISLSRLMPDFKNSRGLVRWLALSHLLWSGSKALFPWIITVFVGLEANGVWAACFGVASIGNMVLVGMQNIAAPVIMQGYVSGGKVELRRLVYRYVMRFSFVMFLFFLFIFFTGDWLVELLYGKQYSGKGLLLSIMALNMFVSAAIFPFSRGLFAMRRVDVDFKINITGIPMLAVTVFLTHHYGLTGAALGMTASGCVSVLLRWIFFEKLQRSVRAKELEPCRGVSLA